MTDYEIAIVGAGLAGLTCAKQLQDQGRQVVVLDKSRGVGGRVATRRLHETRADHGLPYWDSQGELSQESLHRLQSEGLLKPWLDNIYERQDGGLRAIPHRGYVAAMGMNAIAKFLAQDLPLRKQHRITKIQAENTWQLYHTAKDTPLTANVLILAIPAPQAYALLQPLPLPTDWLSQLGSVTYNPCLTVMAGYSSSAVPPLPWQALRPQHPDLAWIAHDSSKRPPDAPPVFVLHSTPTFAQQYLDAPELDPAAKHLLTVAGDWLTPELATPDWWQIHRWRYATPHSPLAADYWATQTPLPLLCCGDWCKGKGIESALHSGKSAAQQVQQWL